MNAETHSAETVQTLVQRAPGRPARLSRLPRWELAGLTALTVLTGLLYVWALSRNNMGNTYYAAAIKSGSLNWKAFLFGSLDPGNFITVDKTPAAFWVPELFARVFGFSSWSMLLPQALAGIASVLILYYLVKRWQGAVIALLASLLFALTPVAVMIFRYNNPDAFLTLLLLLSTLAFWSALERESGWRLAIAGGFVGLAFLTKMLEALLVVPAFVLVYLVCAKPRFLKRVLHLAGALVAMVVAGGWWVLLVELWPTASRPYIGGSTNNSVLDLILSRTAGYTSGSGVDGTGGGGGGSDGGGGGPGGAGGFGGASGWLRMFNDQLGGQISWLLPLALLCLVGGLWITRRSRRTGLDRAGYLLWGLWTLTMVLVFSFAEGVLHPYYSVVLAPGIAALTAAGSIGLWRLGRSNRWLSWVLPIGVLASALWSATLLGRTPEFTPGLRAAVLALGSLGAVVLLLSQLWPRAAGPRAAAAGVAAGVAAVIMTGTALLAGPIAYDLATVSRSVTGPLAAAGPVTEESMPLAFAGQTARARSGPVAAQDIEVAADSGLVAYLLAHQAEAKFLVAVRGSAAATPFILSTDQPVMAMGGFNGGDQAPTLEQFKAMVAAGEVRYVLVDAGTGARPALNLPARPGGALPGPYAMDGAQVGPATPRAGVGGQGSTQAIVQYVRENGTLIPPREYGGTTTVGTLYYLGD